MIVVRNYLPCCGYLQQRFNDADEKEIYQECIEFKLSARQDKKFTEAIFPP